MCWGAAGILSEEADAACGSVVWQCILSHKPASSGKQRFSLFGGSDLLAFNSSYSRLWGVL